ncbi:NTP transferase domain-containing protein [Candidatus Dojkabacteria bacterium]|nr:NTP transferase domain-containing protein [Candidatus Dojkabacteria bacterium]
MQAILLLAGNNSRFFPLETIGHKAMSKLYGKPIAEYLLLDLISIGIDDVIIVYGKYGEEIKTYFGDGTRWDIKIRYAEQQEAKGQADAILSAKNLVNSSFIVPNPQHVLQKEIFKQLVVRFKESEVDALLPGVKTYNPNSYGIFDLDGDQVKAVIEKPDKGEEPSDYRITSAYCFKRDFIEFLEREPEAEYAYEKAITKYAQEKNVQMFKLKNDYIPSLKYPWHLLEIRKHMSKTFGGYVSESAQIADNAIVENSVFVDEGAVIFENACIKGKTYIGKNAVIGNNAVIRDSDIGEEVQVGINSDITRSVIMKGTHSHGGGFIGDSIIGPDSRLAAGLITANKRTDRENIKSVVKEKKVDVCSNALGLVTGQKVKTGINVSSMPGKFVGERSMIWPSAVIYKNLPHHSELKFFQKQEIDTL